MVTMVADVMVATLKDSGAWRVYGIPGDSLNGFTDALRRDGGIAWEHVRHEECSVYCELVSVPAQLPRLLEIAMRAALQRGGVAVVVHAFRGKEFVEYDTSSSPRPTCENSNDATRMRPHRSFDPTSGLGEP